MIAVENSRSEKTAAKEQVGTAFSCVITDERHRTGGEAQQCCDGLDQSVELDTAEPGGPVDGRSDEKKTEG